MRRGAGGKPHRREWLVFGLAGLLLLAAAAVFAGREGARRALNDAAADAQIAARLKVAVLRAEIEKHRSLPVVLAEDPDVAAALGAPGNDRLIEAMNRKLESLSRDTRVGVIYLVDRTGLTVAASNWRDDTSFVGQNYAFRPYFKSAIAEGAAEHFALGTRSNRPGLYLARKVGNGLGAVVIKVEFEALEAEWAEDRDPVMVTDGKGVVLLTDRADWRFQTLAPLDADTIAAVRASLQFGAAPLAPLAFERLPDGQLRIGGSRHIDAVLPVPTTGWSLHLLRGLQPGLRQAESGAALTAGLAAALLLAAAAVLLRRRHRAAEHRAEDAARRQQLEAEVAARTGDLTAANGRLSAEIAERQQLQDELAQANRLAILGQIAASVAHEINQPVAAIRTYADNAAVFLDRAEREAVAANLGQIARLTDRVGAITGQLRNFARRGPRASSAVDLAAVLDGALLLLGPRLRRQGAVVQRALPPGLPRVQGDPVRLEQVLVNLLQNALDAAGEGAAIEIAGSAAGDEVVVTVADNGPGIPPEVMTRLFTPFVTTKAAGLGLGLVISGDIVKDLGGTLHALNRPAGGAEFTLRLQRA
ncbi:sensor histidine kinase [Zavarzinia compransoris]|uniref:sensor histidine kinase n=1 Tax=Zavarzinia compransoris TaxID=1264899 RepID=UPI001B87DD9C|nr:ATP-binding protein [Zavarzinia compransoris]